jgi:hypothetical protein
VGSADKLIYSVITPALKKASLSINLS